MIRLVTFRFFPAPRPKIRIKREMAISKPSGTDQPPVLCRKPKRVGPMEAKRYPIDCAISESSAACWPLFVRSPKNIMAKLKADPPAIQIIITQIGASDVLPNNNPDVPPKNRMPVIATSHVWLFMRPAGMGTTKVNGNSENWTRESVQPACPELSPLCSRISGSQATIM